MDCGFISGISALEIAGNDVGFMISMLRTGVLMEFLFIRGWTSEGKVILVSGEFFGNIWLIVGFRVKIEV